MRFLCRFPASLPGYPTSVTVSNAIKNRASNEEILAILKEVPNPNQDDDDGQFQYSVTRDAPPLCSDRPPVTPSADEGESFNPLKVDVFLQTLLHLAAKSFSHSFSALAK